ncbi:hypothetical protein ACE5IS_14995 [Leptospira wolffii]|uniref:Lipoprotein n=1 Tax=Leptospira wolffii TaxID=409998 RepID=A0ABV5BTS1_9LEPT
MRIQASLLIILFLLSNCRHREYRQVISSELAKEKKVRDALRVRIWGLDQSYLSTFRLTLELKKAYEFKPDQYGFGKHDFSDICEEKCDNYTVDLPPGEYYGKITVSRSETTPFVKTDFSHMEVHFGYYNESGAARPTGQYVRYTDSKCITNRKGNEWAMTSILCPTLYVDETHPNFLHLQIDSKSEPSEKGTAIIWITTFFYSLFTLSPAGFLIPVIVGPIGFEKQVFHNLTPEE